MLRDAFDIAIDQILEGADGDIRLALRTVLLQNVQLEARLLALIETNRTNAPKQKDGTAAQMHGAPGIGGQLKRGKPN
jgi:hypothetical protein